jgi:hypothetical protein
VAVTAAVWATCTKQDAVCYKRGHPQGWPLCLLRSSLLSAAGRNFPARLEPRLEKVQRWEPPHSCGGARLSSVDGFPTSRLYQRQRMLLFCPSDLTAPNKSDHPPLVIPSAAEGPAVRPGSLTKASVPLVLPQTRHPERSASQIDRVKQRLGRGVEGPRRHKRCVRR